MCCFSSFHVRASLAHKCNHSFEPNASFELGFSPRFGLIPTVRTLKDLKAGEELFCSYDYKLDDAPPWYQDLWSNRICKLYRQQKHESSKDYCQHWIHALIWIIQNNLYFWSNLLHAYMETCAEMPQNYCHNWCLMMIVMFSSGN